MRTHLDSSSLAAYIRTLLKLPTLAGGGMPANVDRVLAGRFFQGTVTSFYQTANGYYCQIQRTGDIAADGNTYLCLYANPIVGDVVECIWRDLNIGYVLAPISRLASAPLGTIAYSEVSANQTGITALADLTGLTANYTVFTQARRIRLSFQVVLSSTIAGDVMTVVIEQDAAIQRQIVQTVAPTANGLVTVTGAWILKPNDALYPTVGTVGRYKLGASRTGTGTLTMTAALNQVAYFLIEDIGGV